jgi:BirA family biotin operon repressor/biotin-[acetyl-CoA-carboxylase] ligase
MEEQILKVFKTRPDEFISGEELSTQLSVSRAAVWKHIEKLRKDGYRIEAVPHLGYKLVSVPDRMLAEELQWKLGTSVIGKRIFSYDTVDSTNTIAYTFAQDGLAEGAVVVAEAQRKGKGRLGRQWSSPKGAGIYLSCILRPQLLPLEVPKITLVTAVACVTAVRSVSGLNAQIRWPNDVLINDKKVCGILTEMRAEQDTVNFVIVGIGVNVNTTSSDLPDEATSIKEELGRSVSRIEAGKTLLRQLEHYYTLFKNDGFKPIIDEWHTYSGIVGARVKVACHDRELVGQVQDIDENGALIIRLDNGLLERVLAGDLRLLR